MCESHNELKEAKDNMEIRLTAELREAAGKYLAVVESGRREIERLRAQVAAFEHNEKIDRVAEQEAEVEQLKAALREISEGKGRFSMDHFQHAKNTIEDMKELARAALEEKP